LRKNVPPERGLVTSDQPSGRVSSSLESLSEASSKIGAEEAGGLLTRGGAMYFSTTEVVITALADLLKRERREKSPDTFYASRRLGAKIKSLFFNPKVFLVTGRALDGVYQWRTKASKRSSRLKEE
jgi:hypothetical protein